MQGEWTNEALEWTRETWSLDQVWQHLKSEFGLEVERNTLRNLFVDIGVGPVIKFGSRETGRGRIGYYDQLVCWVGYIAYRAPAAERPALAQRLDEHREAAKRAVWARLADKPKKRDEYTNLAWDWRVESTAYHLFISDVRHSLEPRVLHRLLTNRPQLLYRTLDSNLVLESVLRAYVSRYVREFSGLEVMPDAVNLFAGVREPLFGKSIGSADTIEILDRFGWIKPSGRKGSEPEHLYFDAPDIYSEGDHAPQ